MLQGISSSRWWWTVCSLSRQWAVRFSTTILKILYPLSSYCNKQTISLLKSIDPSGSYRLSGSSAYSETYGNSCLSNSQDFDVKEVEVVNFIRKKTLKILIFFSFNLTETKKNTIDWFLQLWGFVYGSKYDEILALSKTTEPGICRWSWS